MTDILFLLLGLALGTALGWLLASHRTPAAQPDQRVEAELRQQLAQRETELNQTREKASEVGNARSAADAARMAAENAMNEQRQARERLESSLSALRDELNKSNRLLATAQAELNAHAKTLADLRSEHERTQMEAKQEREQVAFIKKQNGELEERAKLLDERLKTERQQVEALQEKFQQAFEAISNKLLANSSSRFNEQSADSMKKLLDPLKETLGVFKSSLDETRKETAAHSALLKNEICRIGAEAANLSKALKGDVKVLGNWGENMLDQILEKSGLQRDIHYRRQRGAKDAEGEQRFLDVIVNLPKPKRGHLVIDSKVSLRSYEEAVNSSDEGARQELLDKHVEAIRKHFWNLGSKRYQDIYGINAPDFVLMYVPIEAAFFAAIAREPGLFADALDKNVVLITNSTLLATLRTVAHVWRLADQQKHTLDIADRGGKLYDKFVGFVEDLQNVGEALKDAQKAWEAASNKLHTGTGNLVRQVDQLKELGAKASKTLPSQLVDEAKESDPPAALPASS